MKRTLLGWGLALALCLQPVAAAAATVAASHGEANVFIYHRFGDSRYPSTNIDLDVFARQLEWLQREHRPVLALGEIVRRLNAGESLPPGCVALTVDDAFRSFLEGGMPLLRKYGYPVTLFVNSDAVGASGYLGWEELRQLSAQGVEIGNHSASHAYLLEGRRGEGEEAWLDRVGGDIERAQKALTDHLGKAPQLFAYPYGEYSPQLEQLLRQQGFAAAVAQQSGVVWRGSDRFALPRFPMGGAYATLAGFREKANMRALPVRVLLPASPVLASAETGPPSLELTIQEDDIDLRGLRCFVQGNNDCEVLSVTGKAGEFRITARAPLSGRRNKYTITAPGRAGGWYWFSQPWFRPHRYGGGD